MTDEKFDQMMRQALSPQIPDEKLNMEIKKLKSKETETIKVGLYFKTEINAADLPSDEETISATVTMNYVQADDTAVERKKAVKASNSLIGKYVDLGKNVVGTEATTDDWRVLYVDESTKTTYLILADYLPAGQMQAGTGIINNGKYKLSQIS